VTIYDLEPEVHVARQAFPDAQTQLAGEPVSAIGLLDVGWYDSSVEPEGGSIAVVRAGGPYDGEGDEGLIGRRLRVTRDGRSVFVYVLGARGVPDDVAVARRAFLALGLLTHDTLPCLVEVVE
jgi:hypothetical protein